MNDTLDVRGIERGADLAKNLDRLFGRKFALLQQRRQVLSLDELHGDEAESFEDAEVKNADHVAMRDFPRQDQFLFESLQNARMAGQFRTDYFQRYQPVEFAVLGFVDRAHSAFPQHFQDLVTIGEHTAGFKRQAGFRNRRFGAGWMRPTGICGLDHRHVFSFGAER